MNVYERIQLHLLPSDDKIIKQYEHEIDKELKEFYRESATYEQKTIDAFCTCLTGWSFKELLEQEGPKLIDKAIDKEIKDGNK